MTKDRLYSKERNGGKALRASKEVSEGKFKQLKDSEGQCKEKHRFPSKEMETRHQKHNISLRVHTTWIITLYWQP